MADPVADARRRCARGSGSQRRRHAARAELERQRARAGLSVGHDPHARRPRRTGDGRGAHATRSATRSRDARRQYLEVFGYEGFLDGELEPVALAA